MSLKVITGTFDVAKVLLFYDITKFSEKRLLFTFYEAGLNH